MDPATIRHRDKVKMPITFGMTSLLQEMERGILTSCTKHT